MNAPVITLGQVLGNLLLGNEIEDLFCIPGDFTMGLVRELSRVNGLNIRTMSHEYGTTLSAFAYSLGKKTPGAVCFTYGVGILNALNAIAQAYVEHVPLLIISGAPGEREKREDIFLHHTISDHDSQYRILREVTVHQTRISDVNLAQEQFEEAIEIAKKSSRPVYIEIPRDLFTKTTPYVAKKRAFPNPSTVSEEIIEAASLVIDLLSDAKSPVFVPGLEIKRYSLSDKTRKIIEALGLPWVESPISQKTIESAHLNFRGVFAGPASPEETTRELVENSDLILLLGEPNADVNMGIGGKVTKENLIHVYNGLIKIGNKIYLGTTPEFIDALYQVAKGSKNAFLKTNNSKLRPLPKKYSNDTDDELTPNNMIDVLNHYFFKYPKTVLITDCGDSFFMSLGMVAHDIITSSLFMSMGIAIPGAIGYQIGSGIRPIVLVGDGAFHMTGAELMHAQRFGVSPIIIILNNSRWISLSTDLKDDELTKQASLEFSRYADFLNMKAFTATSKIQFREFLAKAHDLNEPVLIDAKVDSFLRSDLCNQFFNGIAQQYHLQKITAEEI